MQANTPGKLNPSASTWKSPNPSHPTDGEHDAQEFCDGTDTRYSTASEFKCGGRDTRPGSEESRIGSNSGEIVRSSVGVGFSSPSSEPLFSVPKPSGLRHATWDGRHAEHNSTWDDPPLSSTFSAFRNSLNTPNLGSGNFSGGVQRDQNNPTRSVDDLNSLFSRPSPSSRESYKSDLPSGGMFRTKPPGFQSTNNDCGIVGGPSVTAFTGDYIPSTSENRFNSDDIESYVSSRDQSTLENGPGRFGTLSSSSFDGNSLNIKAGRGDRKIGYLSASFDHIDINSLANRSHTSRKIDDPMELRRPASTGIIGGITPAMNYSGERRGYDEANKSLGSMVNVNERAGMPAHNATFSPSGITNFVSKENKYDLRCDRSFSPLGFLSEAMAQRSLASSGSIEDADVATGSSGQGNQSATGTGGLMLFGSEIGRRGSAPSRTPGPRLSSLDERSEMTDSFRRGVHVNDLKESQDISSTFLAKALGTSGGQVDEIDKSVSRPSSKSLMDFIHESSFRTQHGERLSGEAARAMPRPSSQRLLPGRSLSSTGSNIKSYHSHNEKDSFEEQDSPGRMRAMAKSFNLGGRPSTHQSHFDQRESEGHYFSSPEFTTFRHRNFAGAPHEDMHNATFQLNDTSNAGHMSYEHGGDHHEVARDSSELPYQHRGVHHLPQSSPAMSSGTATHFVLDQAGNPVACQAVPSYQIIYTNPAMGSSQSCGPTTFLLQNPSGGQQVYSSSHNVIAIQQPNAADVSGEHGYYQTGPAAGKMYHSVQTGGSVAALQHDHAQYMNAINATHSAGGHLSVGSGNNNGSMISLTRSNQRSPRAAKNRGGRSGVIGSPHLTSGKLAKNNKKGGKNTGKASNASPVSSNSFNVGGASVTGQPSSGLLEDFKLSRNIKRDTNGQRPWNVYDIFGEKSDCGHIVEFCQDQNGSRFLQSRLDLCSSNDSEDVQSISEGLVILNELLEGGNFDQVKNDVFGNYVVQKILEKGSTEMRIRVKDKVRGEMFSLSLRMYGCRVIQKVLESLDEEHLLYLLCEFHGHVLELIRDQNGNHVCQKIIEVLSTKSKTIGHETRSRELSNAIEFIVVDVLANVEHLSCHPYGCRVLQRMLEHCVPRQKTQVLCSIGNCYETLLDDQYGNYVIQHVLQFGTDEERDRILDLVLREGNGVLKLSRQKFASNVVEKLLQFGSSRQRNAIVSEMLKIAREPDNKGDGDEGSSVVLLMVRDPYANYVVQTTLDVLTEGEERRKLLDVLNANSEQLRNYTFAKHIVSKLSS